MRSSTHSETTREKNSVLFIFLRGEKKNPVRCERSFCGCRKAEDFDEIFLSFTQTLQGLTTLSCQKKNYGGRREKKEKEKEKKIIKTKLYKQKLNELDHLSEEAKRRS